MFYLLKRLVESCFFETKRDHFFKRRVKKMFFWAESEKQLVRLIKCVKKSFEMYH